MKKQQWRNLAATGCNWILDPDSGERCNQCVVQPEVFHCIRSCIRSLSYYDYYVFSSCITISMLQASSGTSGIIWIHGLARAALREMSFTQGEDVLTQGEQGAMVPWCHADLCRWYWPPCHCCMIASHHYHLLCSRCSQLKCH